MLSFLRNLTLVTLSVFANNASESNLLKGGILPSRKYTTQNGPDSKEMYNSESHHHTLRIP